MTRNRCHIYSMYWAATEEPAGDLTPFITEWVVGNESFTFPMFSGRTYDCTIDWGDGSPLSTVTAWDDPDATHVYTSGTYQIKIYGTFPSIRVNYGAVASKLINVIQWGDVGFNTFRTAFSGCDNLLTLPTGSITGATDVASFGFYFAFDSCESLQSIPAGLFDLTPNVSNDGFSDAFWGCTSLTSIPADLFKYNTLVTNLAFFDCFSSCANLTSIPADLFKYNILASTQAFGNVFSSCPNITSIPTDLFRYNVLVDDYGFNNSFQGCSGLTSIPTDLFRYNTLVGIDGFLGVFGDCTSLTTIPIDIFKYNVNCVGFSGAFTDCILLESVPTDLFWYNTLATDFSQLFDGCLKLQFNRNIFFDDGEETTRFLNQSVDFLYAFRRNSFTGAQGEAPTLWDCDFGTGTPIKTGCFFGVGNDGVSISNYGDIPVDWK